MILFILLNFIVVLIYIKVTKRLSPIESLGTYFVSILYLHDWLIIVSVNLKWMETTKSVPLGFLLSINLILLFPILSLIFIEMILKRGEVSKKIMTFVLWIITFLSLEFLSDITGLINHTKWTYSLSSFLWIIYGVILLLSVPIFRKLVKREV